MTCVLFQTSIGTGVAFAHKYLGTNNLCVALYGDGAANNGQVFESFNLSKLWDIPVLYVVENNLYGLGTSAERSSASTEYYKRGDYVPGIWVGVMSYASGFSYPIFVRTGFESLHSTLRANI